MENPFLAFMRLREEKSAAPVEGVTASIKLQKRDGTSEFSPFVVDRTSHPGLAKIVKAFLDSDKVPLGYTTIDKNKGVALWYGLMAEYTSKMAMIADTKNTM